jgi:hypothetical protein
MRLPKFLATFLLILVLASGVFAQSTPAVKYPTSSQYWVGVTGGDSFNNTNLGIEVGLEKPFSKRFAISLTERFLPLETKRALGTGDANIVRGTTYVWLTPKFGFAANAELSSYSISQVNKATIYVFGGPVWRHTIFGAPARLELDYVGQVDNHYINQFLVNHNLQTGGIEPGQMQGARFALNLRAGCFSNFCVNINEEYSLGRVLTQGNPICDGTIGNGSQAGIASCPRGSGISGSVAASVRFVFPRPRGHENDLF